MDPWSLMQEMYIISGKPMMSGKLATAILNNSLADPLRPVYSGEGDERTIVLTGRPEGEVEHLSVTLKVKDAKTENAQWKKNPDQMLMYAASRMWGRRYTPDIILGIVFDDEEIGAANPADKKSQVEWRQVDDALTSKFGETPPVIDQETGEVLDTPRALPKNPNEKWYDWGARLVSCMRSSPDIDTADQWLAKNSDLITECEKDAPKVHGNLGKAISEIKLTLLNREGAAT
jgi:hypothetical protein